MGSLNIPQVRVDTFDMGVSPVSNPNNLMLEINGTLYSAGFVYDNGTYQRQIFPTYNSSNNRIYLKVINLATSGTASAATYYNVKVLIIG